MGCFCSGKDRKRFGNYIVEWWAEGCKNKPLSEIGLSKGWLAIRIPKLILLEILSFNNRLVIPASSFRPEIHHSFAYLPSQFPYKYIKIIQFSTFRSPQPSAQSWAHAWRGSTRTRSWSWLSPSWKC